MKKLFTAMCVAVAVSAQAQTNVDLNPVTVTATRTPDKITETGRSITVIDGKYFNSLPVNSIDEILKYVPGVEIQQRGPKGSQSDVVIRGGTFQQVLVLLDGIKINDPVTGHFSSYVPVAPYEIERIEILRGPAAAVYGAEAVGGVVNIITKTFNKLKKEKSNKVSASSAGGEYGFLNTDIGFIHTAPKTNIALGYLSNNADGQLLRGNNRGFFHNNTLSASAGFELHNNWQLFLRSSLDERNFAAQNFYTTFASDTATEIVKSWWNQAKLLHTTAKNSDEIDVAYKQASDHYVFNSKTAANDNKSKYVTLQYIHSGSFSPSLKMNYGVTADNKSIRSNDRGNHSTSHAAAFTSLKYKKGNFNFQPSLRIDMDENYGTEILPQANISYSINKIVLRANAGRAIRSADYTERYNNYGKALVTSGTIGNPDLGAERSWSYEAGADVLLSHFKISATGFYRDQNNMIDFVPTAYADMPRKVNLVPTGSYTLAKNIKKVKTSGAEFEISYQQAIGKRQSIYINTGATFLHSTSSDPVPSFYIISHAKAMVQGNIIYTVKGLTVSFNAIYKNRQGQQASAINAEITKDYFLLNGKVQYQVNKTVNLFVSTDNIGNVRYSDLLGSPMPRRWTSGGIRLNFE